MKSMLEYELVRQMYHRDGLSRREISRRTGYHRNTISRMLQYSAPPGYQLGHPRSKYKLAPYIPVIDQILEDDRSMPKKQRHTAKRIFDRLCAEHRFSGSYTIIKDYVRDKRIRLREVFLPLLQRPGTAQVDFGEVQIRIGGVLQKGYIFCMALPYSDATCVQAYPTEAFEAVAAGHNTAYTFFGGVPSEGLYDNMPTAVVSVGEGQERVLTEDFIRLRSHYLFRSRFCNVGRPNEKGVVEGLVKYVRRNFFVPILSFPTWEALNVYLLDVCTRRLSEKAAGKDKTIGELLQEERGHFLPLPDRLYDDCKPKVRRSNSLSLVTYKTNQYSVPVEYAYRVLTVKAYVFQLVICYKDQVIATHKRSYGRNDFIADPLHYLPLLGKKPGGLDGARPFSGWELPECFDTLRRYLEGRGGYKGKREYIEVLQLLRHFSIPELRRAIERSFALSAVTAESVKLLLLSGREKAIDIINLSEERLQGLPKVTIKQTDTACYGILLSEGSVS